MEKEELIKLVNNFKIDGNVINYKPYGEGHINTTYLVEINNKGKVEKYILQKINDSIFHPVEKLMNNIVYVTKYIQNSLIKENKDPKKHTLTVINTKNDESFIKFNDAYYRIYIFIDNSITYQMILNPNDFYYCAKSFGDFYRLLDGFDASKLYEILPNFHNTRSRYNDFLKAVNEDKYNLKKTCEFEIKFIKDREHYYSQIVDKLENKTLPLKVTHNDTKLNNILFDKETNLPLAVIDLDTIMPGTICYDFGDSIRFGCNSSFEDEKDLDKVHFRFDLYKLYLKGFLETLGDNITKEEKENLALASIMMTIECGMRFLADYLEGSHYFKTKYPEHNLIRCRTQLKLVKEMEERFQEMNDLIKD